MLVARTHLNLLRLCSQPNFLEIVEEMHWARSILVVWLAAVILSARAGPIPKLDQDLQLKPPNVTCSSNISVAFCTMCQQQLINRI
jgi:hypothetical protein